MLHHCEMTCLARSKGKKSLREWTCELSTSTQSMQQASTCAFFAGKRKDPC